MRGKTGFVKQVFGLFLALVLCMSTVLPAFADESTFRTNLTGWKASGAAAVGIETAGAKIASNGDGFYMSENKFIGNLVYETDITLTSGTAFGLVFNAQKADDVISSGSYVINFDLSRRTFRFFQFPYQNAEISDLAEKSFTSAGFTPAIGNTYHLTLHVYNGKMSFWINGVEVFTNVVDTVGAVLDSGYVGFITYNSTAVFQNTYAYGGNALPVGHPMVGTFAGNSTEGYALQRTGGNNWVAFSGKGESITYDFTMDLLDGTNVVGGAMFGIGNPKSIANPWYGVHIEQGSKRLRLFREGGGLNVYADLQTADFSGPMNVRTSIKGKAVNIYINDMTTPRITATLPETYAGGHIGLMTWQSEAVFTKMRLYDNLMRSTPMLDSIALEGAALNETFDPLTTTYTANVDHTVESVAVTPTLQGSGALIYVDNKLVASGEASSPVSLVTGDNTITIRLVDIEDTEITNRYTITVNKALNPALRYSEPYRPQFHFSPINNWMNDPNGLVYNATTGEYHMFYQYNPFGIAWGNMSWGHAVSKDLVSWEEKEVVLRPDSLGTIFSGSAVIDYKNTSGLFTENVPPASRMVAIFTHDGGSQTYGNEKQSIAYSLDDGDTWIKYEGNPVLRNPGNMYGGDFRDPKVLWMEDPSLPNGGEWLMVVAGGRARIFTSPDLINWTHNNDLFYDHQSGSAKALYSECPDLFPLAVDGASGNIKWVYTGSGRFYVIGDLVKENGKWNFINTTQQYSPYNGGEMMYATQSFYNDVNGLSHDIKGGGRRLLVSWMQDGSGSALPGKTWDGYQSVPLVTGLRTDVDGVVKLVSYVPEEFKNLRSGDPLISIRDEEVNAGDDDILAGITGDMLDIEAEFTIGTATEFGFNVRTNSNETQKTTVKYDVTNKKFILDRSASGLRINGIRSLDMKPLAGNKVKMRILVDTSIIDAFGNDGIAAIDSTFYPDPNSVGMSFYSKGGTVTIDSLDIYEMESAWTGASGPSEPLGVSLYTEMDSVALDSTFTVSATVIPRNATDKTVSWDYDESLFELVSITDTGITLKAISAGTGTVTAITNTGNYTGFININVIDFQFDTNLDQWRPTSGNWSMVESGYVLSQSGGNSFNVAGQGGKSIVYDLEFAFSNSGSKIGGPVFGAVSASPGNDWFAVHIQNGGGTIRLFDETTYNQTGGLNAYQNISPALNLNEKIYVRVDIDSSGNIKVYADNSPLGDNPTPRITAKSNRYHGGYVGLMAFDSGATFTRAWITVRDTVSITDPGISAGTWDPDYNPSETDNTAMVDGNVESVTFTPEIEGEGYVTFNGKRMTNGLTSSAFPLNVGENIISVKLYNDFNYLIGSRTITIIRSAAPSKAGLIALIESVAELDEENYTEDSWSALMEALGAAQGVADDADATSGEIEEAETALRKAIDSLELYVEVTSVKIDGAAIQQVRMRNTKQFTATVNPTNATDTTLKWESSNEKIFTVNDGLVTGIGTGSAKLIVTCGGKTSFIMVQVTA